MFAAVVTGYFLVVPPWSNCGAYRYCPQERYPFLHHRPRFLIAKNNGDQMVGKFLLIMPTPPISDTSEFMIIEYSNAIGALDIQGNMGAIPEG
jgi:hypothetical protein